MREILFRGKRNCDNVWIYGNLMVDESGEGHIVETDVVVQDGHHIRIDSDAPMFFNQNTIGQYTGITDMNGVKIFEGDIVKAGFLEHKCRVVCDVEDARFMCYTIENEPRIMSVALQDKLNESALAVIGNIYE